MPWTRSRPLLHVQVSGRGPPLALVHEMGGSSWSWRKAADRLAADFTVIAYDQRGAGLSEKPREAFTPAALAQDLGRVLDEFCGGERVFLAGAAAGAAVVADFALGRPQTVPALALCAPALGVEPSARAQALARAEQVARDGMAALAETALGRIYPEPLRGADFAEYRARFLAHDPVGFALLNMAFAETEVAATQIGGPCLVLAGGHDVRPVAQIAALADSMSDAQFAVIDGGGHVMAHQAPEAVAERLARFFLQGDRQL